MLIIENGGAVLDVSVEHPLYGEIKGGLYLYNEQDVKDFMAKVRKQGRRCCEFDRGLAFAHTTRANAGRYRKN